MVSEKNCVVHTHTQVHLFKSRQNTKNRNTNPRTFMFMSVCLYVWMDYLKYATAGGANLEPLLQKQKE